jgi:hypothetical protein
MLLARIRTDFNSNSLGNRWALEDLERQGIELHEGMRCIFYDLDAQDGQSGFLHSEGTVWWDAETGVFRIDMRTLNFQFTPGEDLRVLDAVYSEAGEHGLPGAPAGS